MRIFIVLVSLLSFSLTNAQRGGGGMGGGQGGGRQGGGQGGQQQQRQEIREFDASKVAGIFNYDDDEAIKKIKLKKKKNKDLILNARRAIINYNNSVNEIALLNKDNFDTLNVFVNAIMKSSQRGRNNDSRGSQQMGGQQMGEGNDRMQRGESEDNPIRKAKKLVEEKIEPAKNAVADQEIILNRNLKSMLSEKQYKKWLKYQEDFKEEMNPKPQSNNNQQGGGMQMRSGGGGGQGGGGRGMR